MASVSLVIPVYNAQEYLPRFLHSLQGQTITDFEAIFVDDASGDGSLAQLEGAASADARLLVLSNARNMGAGAARNIGIRAASGETLCFADPDDLLPETSLEARLKAYRTHNAIVRACHVEMTNEGDLLNHEQRPATFHDGSSPEAASARLGINPFLCAHWAWLFPTKMLQRLEIFNEEGTRTAEDIMFLVRLYHHVKKLVWIPDTVYHWMKRRDSLSNTIYDVEQYGDYLHCVEAFYEQSQPLKKLPLADRFCAEYLGTYLRHLLYQAAHGKSSEQDVHAVLGEALRICDRFDTLARCGANARKNPLQHPGFFMLLTVLEGTAPTMTERLLVGYNALERLAETAKAQKAESPPIRKTQP